MFFGNELVEFGVQEIEFDSGFVHADGGSAVDDVAGDFYLAEVGVQEYDELLTDLEFLFGEKSETGGADVACGDVYRFVVRVRFTFTIINDAVGGVHQPPAPAARFIGAFFLVGEAAKLFDERLHLRLCFDNDFYVHFSPFLPDFVIRRRR